ncbi:MAG TPA: hypothetical protein VMR16_00505 [Candidatus Saccharimonadales bacterium]|nr:hypothetical protein [Candidatus Saccharimonadales bacterium]
MKVHQKTVARVLSVISIAGILVFQTVWPITAYADPPLQITNRALTLVAGSTDGGSKPGGMVKHDFSFTIHSNTNVGSIQFLYCTLAAGACVTPTGLVTTGATLTGQTGATGFSIDTAKVNGSPYITRTAASVPATQAVTYELSNVQNPTATNQTFYVRITTYSSTDTSGTAIDLGTVAASTATQIVLTGTMPESLVFCAGATVGVNVGSGLPDCSTATPGAVAFNQLFSPTDTATAFSEMSASTNAGAGYAITVNGTTLTSGANTVAGMGDKTSLVSNHGISEFGMNLKENTVLTSTVPVGLEVSPVDNGNNYRGEAAAGYNVVDHFSFFPGNIVADSSDGGAGGTDAQIFRVSYIVNVPGSQPAGTYSTTLTYICTPTF